MSTAPTSRRQRRQRKASATPLMLALEPRIMFDAAAGATVDQVPEAVAAERSQTASHDNSPPPAIAEVQAEAPPAETTAAAASLFQLSDPGQSAQLSSLAHAASQAIREYLGHQDASSLFALFNGGQSSPTAEWLTRAEQLRQEILSGDYQVSTQLLGPQEMGAAFGAFAAEGPQGQPALLINRYWQNLFDPQTTTRVLIEELGHALDQRLNPEGDTAGDEGERFAAAVLGTPGKNGLTEGRETGQVSINGKSYEVEYATFNFGNAYAMVYDLNNNGQIDNTETWAAKEQNSHFFNTTELGAAIVDDSYFNSKYFSGNDVSAIGVIIGGQTYYGWISRPIKSGGIVRGFYFWTDDNFTSLSIAQTDGNQDGDSTITDNKGFLLVVDQPWFTEQIATKTQYTLTTAKDGNPGSVWVDNVGSSSDRVDSALNALIDTNTAPVANNDSATGTPGSSGGAALEAGYNITTLNRLLKFGVEHKSLV